MSIDSYFCFCCLSTNELTNLFSENSDSNYANVLMELFSIKPLQEEYEFDSYICEECAKRLKDMQNFKRQVLDTLNILQVNGLIMLTKNADLTMISKVSHGYTSDMEDKKSFTQQEKQVTELRDNVTKEIQPPTNIKLECNTIILEREKRITVQRKKKREPIVKEVLYEVTEDFKCKLCSAELPNLYTYHSHMNRHFPNHICETCGKGFLTKKRLKRHMPSHIKGPFKCEECNTEFSNYNTLCSHRQRKHKSIALYACPHCPERFPTLTRRARHLEEAHGARAPHACRVCARRFMLAGNMTLTHLAKEDLRHKYLCMAHFDGKFVVKKTGQRKRLSRYATPKHYAEDDNPPSPIPSTSQGNLSTHVRNTHLRVKPHACADCGAAFAQKQELRGHMAVHTGLNEFQCALCPKSYPRKKALDVHMRTHDDDKRFCCDKCGKKFLQKCTLLTHAKVHNRPEKIKVVTVQS